MSSYKPMPDSHKVLPSVLRIDGSPIRLFPKSRYPLIAIVERTDPVIVVNSVVATEGSSVM